MADTTGDDSVLSGEVAVTFAGLSDAAQQQVYDALAQGVDATASIDVREVVHDAAQADYHRAQADEFQVEQARAAGLGDWQRAHEFAEKAEAELASAAEFGASDVPVAEAHADVLHLENATWEQRMANQDAHAAVTAAQDGSGGASQVYADAADRHQGLADDAGHQGSGVLHEETGSAVHDDQPTEHAADADSGAASDAAQPADDHSSSSANTYSEPGVDAGTE